MDLMRILRHLSNGRATARHVFPPAALDVIERAIRATETQHSGQIRFAVEASLELAPLLAGQSARERAQEVFAQLRVWDTEQNNGVLIYLLLADRDVEIVADRGIHRQLGAAAWEAICREMEAAFRDGRFEQGVLIGVDSVGQHLTRHYPHAGEKTNELPDRPVLI